MQGAPSLRKSQYSYGMPGSDFFMISPVSFARVIVDMTILSILLLLECNIFNLLPVALACCLRKETNQKTLIFISAL